MEYQEWKDKCLQAGFNEEFIDRFNYYNKENIKRKELIRQEALKTAKSIASKLKANNLARKIFLFGSFARNDFHENSDLDLYVVGMEEDIEEAYKIAETLSKSRAVSFIFEADKVPWIEDVIKREGVEL